MVGLRKIYVGIGVGQWYSVAYGAEAAAHIAVTLDLGKNLKSYNWDLPDFFCLADSAASLCIASIRSNSSSVISLTPVSFLLHEVTENATLMSAMAVNGVFFAEMVFGRWRIGHKNNQSKNKRDKRGAGT